MSASLRLGFGGALGVTAEVDTGAARSLLIVTGAGGAFAVRAEAAPFPPLAGAAEETIWLLFYDRTVEELGLAAGEVRLAATGGCAVPRADRKIRGDLLRPPLRPRFTGTRPGTRLSFSGELSQTAASSGVSR